MLLPLAMLLLFPMLYMLPPCPMLLIMVNFPMLYHLPMLFMLLLCPMLFMLLLWTMLYMLLLLLILSMLLLPLLTLLLLLMELPMHLQILLKSPHTITIMLLLMTTLERPSTRLRQMMEMVLLKDHTQLTFLMAVCRPSPTMPMIMMDSFLKSPMKEPHHTLKWLPVL